MTGMTAQDLLPPPATYKLTVADYLTLDRDGVFAGFAKSELIEGEIIVMNAQHRPHARIKMALYDAVRDQLLRLGGPLTALVEVSIEAPPHNVPEPDILLTCEPDGEGLVPLASVALIIEVSDTSLDHDLKRKSALYARLGVPEYWVADVNGRVIHQLWAPAGEAYAQRREVAFGEALAAVTVEGLRVETTAI
jgi:Uma2 family endonuclease